MSFLNNNGGLCRNVQHAIVYIKESVTYNFNVCAYNIKQNLFLSSIIIIISIFQKDNIFGTNASLTYGPQLQIFVLEHVTYLQ